jgi:hypothetical protein
MYSNPVPLKTERAVAIYKNFDKRLQFSLRYLACGMASLMLN